MKRILTFLVVAAMAAACSPTVEDNKVYTAPKFKSEQKVEFTPLSNQLIIDHNPDLFMIGDNKLMICSKCADNNHNFQIVDAQSGEYISSFGIKGRGPYELSDFSRKAVDAKRGVMYLMSQNSELLQVDLAKAIGGNHHPYIGEKTGKIKGNPTQFIFALNGELLQVHSNRRMALTSLDMQDTLGYYDDYPSIESRVDAERKKTEGFFMYNAIYGVKPDNSKMYCVTRTGMILEIFDVAKSGKIRQREIKRFFEPKPQSLAWGTDDCIFGAIYTCATDKYIYVLYSDKPNSEPEHFRLGVFDWSGNPFKAYTFDPVVARMAISLDDKYCYGWVQNADGEEYLGYFDLK